MNQWSLVSLQFAEVKEQIKKYIRTPMGIDKIELLQPSAVREWVRIELSKVQEGLDFVRLRGDFALTALIDIRPVLTRATLESTLTALECLHISQVLIEGDRVQRAINNVEEHKAKLSSLRYLAAEIESLKLILSELQTIIDEQGLVRNEASQGLLQIRQQISSLKQQIQNLLQQLLHSPHITKMLQESLFTKRYDRYVLPVKQEYRGIFKGIVHDQSSSGATLFMEPERLIPLNNKLRELEVDELQEIEKILHALTLKIKTEAKSIAQNVDLLAEFDLILAKVAWAHETDSICPVLAEEHITILKQARHPLIPKDKVVPIDLQLNSQERGIVITGPNTGGKTVVLKIVGLFSMLAQSGIPIPVADGTMLPIYTCILADIGDEQSIEQNLSTFSSHITRILSILPKLDNSSLVLLDELGAGTDPDEGAALAIALLEYISDKGSTFIATTHHSSLKVFAYNHPLIINASVEFDIKTLHPTYRLLLGIPGSSNAFHIAQRLGLKEEIIKRAKEQLSGERNNLEGMIASLSEERHKVSAEKAALQKQRYDEEERGRFLQSELEMWESEKVIIREKARQEAKEIISKAQTEADEVIRRLREISKGNTQIKDHELGELAKRLNESVPVMQLPSRRVPLGSSSIINIGDEVLVYPYKQTGTVLQKVAQGYEVQVGQLRFKVANENLQKIETSFVGSSNSSSTLKRSQETIKPELHLRGLLLEESIQRLDQYLDSALLNGFNQVTIIHGKGTGVLRKGVHSFLGKHKNVQSFRLGNYNEGGLGVTIVELGNRN